LLSYIQAEICYSKSTSGYRPLSLFYHLPTSPTVFLDLNNCGFCWKFANISLVSCERSLLHPVSESVTVCRPLFWMLIGVTYNFKTPKALKEMCLAGSPTNLWRQHQQIPIGSGDAEGLQLMQRARCWRYKIRAAVRESTVNRVKAFKHLVRVIKRDQVVLTMNYVSVFRHLVRAINSDHRALTMNQVSILIRYY